MKTANHDHLWGDKYLRVDCPHCHKQWVIAYEDGPKQYEHAGPEWRCDGCKKAFRVRKRWFYADKTPRSTRDG